MTDPRAGTRPAGPEDLASPVPAGSGSTATATFEALAAAHLERPRAGRRRMFGRDCLTDDGRIVAFLDGERLTVRLPADEAESWLAAGVAVTPRMGKRSMRGWIAVELPSTGAGYRWEELVERALAHITGEDPAEAGDSTARRDGSPGSVGMAGLAGTTGPAPADTAAPAETAPAETASAGTASADTAPADTAPADTPPADTPAARFADLVAAFAGRPGVDEPGSAGRRGFGSDALTVHGSIFAMMRDEHLVLKLPADRVAVLVAAAEAEPLTFGRGPMKEWAVLVDVDPSRWPALTEEAHTFVAAGGRTRAPRRS